MPFARIPVIPPVVEVLFTRSIFTLFSKLEPSDSIAVPLPAELPEYLYSNVGTPPEVEINFEDPLVYIPTPLSCVSIP